MRFTLILALAPLPITAGADPLPTGGRLYVDGDTVVLTDVHGGTIEHIRLIGYDAPEVLHPKCPDERQRGILAAAQLAHLIAAAHVISVDRSRSHDKYRRTDAR